MAVEVEEGAAQMLPRVPGLYRLSLWALLPARLCPTERWARGVPRNTWVGGRCRDVSLALPRAPPPPQQGLEQLGGGRVPLRRHGGALAHSSAPPALPEPQFPQSKQDWTGSAGSFICC